MRPFWSTVSTYPAEFAGKLTKGLSALGSGVEHTLGLSEYHTMDVNRPGYTLSAYSDAVRDTVSEDFNPTQRRAYNGVNTLVDEALEFAVGRGIAAATGAEDAAKIAMLIYDTVGAYGDASYDAALNGATTNESIASATTTAGFHWLVNEINVDTLLNIKSRSDWDSVTNFIVDGVGNVSQVQLEYLGDLIIETAILAEDSSFNQQVESLVHLFQNGSYTYLPATFLMTVAMGSVDYLYLAKTNAKRKKYAGVFYLILLSSMLLVISITGMVIAAQNRLQTQLILSAVATVAILLSALMIFLKMRGVKITKLRLFTKKYADR